MRCFSVEKKTVQSMVFILAVFSFFGILTNIILSDSNIHAATQTASQTAGPNTISMSSDDSVAIAVIPTSEQTVYTGTNALSVTNSCPSGATITITTNSNSDTSLSNKLVRSGSDDLTKEINPTTGSNLVNNSWGYSINNGTNYYAVPTKDDTPATIYDSSSATSSAETVNVKYGVKMNHDLPSGNYSNDVVYTVAVKPACLSYTLKWDLDGGTGKAGADYSDAQVSYGANINLTNYTPTRDGYTFNGWSNGSSSFTGNETSVNANTENTRTVTLKAQWIANCTINCTRLVLSENEGMDYDYTGENLKVTLVNAGYYKLEAWGSQGANNSEYSGHGGYGGYATGNISVTQNTDVYVLVGGTDGINGGGITNSNGVNGGDATSISKVSGKISSNSISNIYLIAGGGGGVGLYGTSNGGNGGGTSGGNGSGSGWSSNPGLGGSQSSGGRYGLCNIQDNGQCGQYGSYGQGGGLYQCNRTHCNTSSQAGGGGGYYGGGSARHAGAGGGSSYVGGVQNGSTTAGQRTGTGYARITYLGTSI